MGVNSAAGSANVTKFEIYSNYNGKLDMSGGISRIFLYESVLDNTVRSTAYIVDSGYRSNKSNSEGSLEKNDLNLTAGEKVILSVEDNLKNKLNYELRIREVIDVIEHSSNSVFTIDMYSKESIDNLLFENSVSKDYHGKIPETIEKILKEVLKTSKKVNIDSGLNDLNVNGHVQQPFKLCHWLAKRCVPEMSNSFGNLAGYLFYETSKGFNFKSIDKLFQQKPKKSYIFTNTTQLPPGYNGKILDYAFQSSIDIEKKLLTGAFFESYLKTFDPYTNEYREDSFNHSNQLKKENMGGREIPKLAADLQIQNKPTRTSVRFTDTGVYPNGSDLKTQLQNSKETVNFNVKEILRQSYMRYNNLFSIKLSVTIPADFSLNAGDLIKCDFPEIGNKRTKSISDKKSGIYMIVDICHSIDPKETFTRMNLVRESIYKK
jgi:hypothetical protein